MWTVKRSCGVNVKNRKNISLSPETVTQLDALAKANATTASGMITALIHKQAKLDGIR